jgi:3',5'-cyclic AMP phosphodiesterase CpdA
MFCKMKSFSISFSWAGIVLLFLIQVIVSSCGKGVEEEKKSWFFVQITDPQLGFYPDSLEKEIRNFEHAIRRINEIKPDFVVITGDFVHLSKDEKQFTEYKRITEMIRSDVPVYQIPGNHDVENEPTADDLAFYKGRYGDDKFSFLHKNHLFIGINSNLIKSHTERFEAEQLDWLTEELNKGKEAESIILFSHHPFFTHDINEPEAYFNLDTAARHQYFELFSKSGVKAIFAGHHHQNGYGVHNGIEMVTTCAVGEPLGPDPVGIRLIKLEENKLKHQYFALDSIPDIF